MFYTKLLFLALISSSSFAWQSGEANLYLGGVHIKQANGQFGGIQDALGNIYSTTKTDYTSFLVGLGYFFNVKSYQNLDLDLGAQVYYLSGAESQGIIYQEGSFPNLSYQYKTQNTPLYAAAKLKWNTNDKKTAFVVDAGIGPNFSNTNNYYEESIDNGITIPNQAYYGQNKTMFSAMVGAGMRFNNVWHNASLEVGYKYFYLNKSKLAPRNGVTTSLATTNNNANALVLTLVA